MDDELEEKDEFDLGADDDLDMDPLEEGLETVEEPEDDPEDRYH
jgi:hypothetical protein